MASRAGKLLAMGVLGGNKTVTRMVSTRGDVPINRVQATLSSRVCIEGRTRHVITDNVPWIQIIDGGYYATTSENSLGNATTIEQVIEVPSGQTSIGGPSSIFLVRALYGGQNTGSIPDGSAETSTDRVYASSFGIPYFPRGLVFWRRVRRTVNLNEYFPSWPTGVTGVTGEGSYFSDGNQTNQVFATGAMTTPTGGSGAGYSTLPLAIVGPVKKNLSVLGIGDSLIYGSNDAFSDGSAGGGWFARALNSVGGRTVAWGRVARGSSTAVAYVGSGSTKRSAMYKYYSHVVIHHGTNDKVTSSRTAAQVMADLLTIAQACKAAGVRRVALSGVFPRDSTTDSGATVANQTPVSGFETGGSFRDPLNALMAALGSGADEYFNLSSTIADTTVPAPDKWAAGLSTDTIHPSSGTPSSNLGTAFAAIAANWAEAA